MAGKGKTPYLPHDGPLGVSILESHQFQSLTKHIKEQYQERENAKQTTTE